MGIIAADSLLGMVVITNEEFVMKSDTLFHLNENSTKFPEQSKRIPYV